MRRLYESDLLTVRDTQWAFLLSAALSAATLGLVAAWAAALGVAHLGAVALALAVLSHLPVLAHDVTASLLLSAAATMLYAAVLAASSAAGGGWSATSSSTAGGSWTASEGDDVRGEGGGGRALPPLCWLEIFGALPALLLLFHAQVRGKRLP